MSITIKETKYIMRLPGTYDFDELWGKPYGVPKDAPVNFYGHGYLGMANYYSSATIETVNLDKDEKLVDKLTLYSSKEQATRRLNSALKEAKKYLASQGETWHINSLPILTWIDFLEKMKVYKVEVEKTYNIGEVWED